MEIPISCMIYLMGAWIWSCAQNLLWKSSVPRHLQFRVCFCCCCFFLFSSLDKDHVLSQNQANKFRLQKIPRWTIVQINLRLSLKVRLSVCSFLAVGIEFIHHISEYYVVWFFFEGVGKKREHILNIIKKISFKNYRLLLKAIKN